MRKTFCPEKSLSYSGRIRDLLNLCQDRNQTNISSQDKNGRTVLHYAAEYGKTNISLIMVDIILNALFILMTTSIGSETSCSQNDSLNIPTMSLRKIRLLRHTYPEILQKLLDCQDLSGDTALHLAASAGNASVVTKLITAGANFRLKNTVGDTSLLLIYKYAPKALKAVYDTSIESVFNDSSDENSTFEIDFSSLVELDDDSEKLRPESKLLFKYISNIRNRSTKELFNHPLIQIFIDLKWRKIRVLMWLSVIFHMIWLSVYSSLIGYVYMYKCSFEAKRIYRGYVLPRLLNESQMDLSSEPYKRMCKLNYVKHFDVLLVIMIVFSLVILANKIFELRASKSCKFCCLNMENICQILIIFVMLITLLPVAIVSVKGSYDREHFEALHILSSLGIFLAWLLMFWQCRKFPTMALYIEIWGNVMKGFAKFMATFASLLFAFAFAFQILLPSEPRHNKFFFNFMRLFVMMAGEIGFDTFFFPEVDSKTLPFPQTTKFVYFVFVIMVSIILFNVLVSMTVSDTQELRKTGRLRRFASQLESIYFMEHFLLNSLFQCCAKRLLGRLQVTLGQEKGYKRVLCLKDISEHLHDALIALVSLDSEMDEISGTTLEKRRSKYFEGVEKQEIVYSTFKILNENDSISNHEINVKTSFDSNKETSIKASNKSNNDISKL